jgi:hypothetical protein
MPRRKTYFSETENKKNVRNFTVLSAVSTAPVRETKRKEAGEGLFAYKKTTVFS